MTLIRTGLDTEEKLTILSRDSQYDLACACGATQEDKRKRSKQDTWIYPVALPDRPKTFLFKTLVSNVCTNDCAYCPLRNEKDPVRTSLSCEETVKVFSEYLRSGRVQGLFLSSGVTGTPDRTMEQINTIAGKVRQKGFKGYMHLKIIPGSSDAAIEDALSLASTVSINIEVPGDIHFRKLSSKKDYTNDIIHPLKLIHSLTRKGARYQRVKQTTQFVVGASDETDREIIRYMTGLYDRLKLQRIYFSAYQRGLGTPSLPGETSSLSNADILTREHRLYQSDFLMRKYRFTEDMIPVGPGGNLSLETDPKEMFALKHPEQFPVDVNRAGYYKLLCIPGIGPVTAKRILKIRSGGGKIRRISDIGKPGKLLNKAERHMKFGWG